MIPLACGGLQVAAPPSDAAPVDVQAAVDVEAPPDAAPHLLNCGPGAIVIEIDCEILTAWRCQVPTELWRVPCVVPNLRRLLVASCDLCITAEQLAGDPQ
jgi:hypothetical protein